MTEDAYPTRTGTEPRLIERGEPVVAAWREDAPITREAYESYRRNGFLVLENVFDQDELANLQAEADRLSSDTSGIDPETVIAEPKSGAVRSIFRIHEANPLMGRLAADRRLAGVASFLLGEAVAVHQSRINYKPGLHGRGFYWHSDFETWHAEDGMPAMRALSASVLLTDNSALNGPLLLIPGSHEVFVSCVGETPADNYQQSLKQQDVGVPDDVTLTVMAERNGIAAATGKAGTVIFFDCNTMHGSNDNITPMPRSNAFFVFNAVSNRLVEPFAAPVPRPDFVAARDAAPLTIRDGRLDA